MSGYRVGWQWADDESDSDSTDSGASRTERMQEVDDDLWDLEDFEDHNSWTLMVPIYLDSMLQCPWFPTLRPEDHMPH